MRMPLLQFNFFPQKIQNGIKRKATDDLSERPTKLINRAFHDGSSEGVTTQDLKNIRQSIYRSRRSLLPKLPQSREDVHDALESVECVTNKNEKFLLINNRENNIIIFSCETNLKYLCTCSKIYIDGTFDYCTKFFCQLFTIHAFKNGHYIPVVFMLLPDKQSSTYATAFNLLIEYCHRITLVFNPAEVVCDFENSIHLGIKQIWPTIIINGCRFHLTQSWFRKLQNLGLTSEYKDENSKIGCWLRWTFGLLFLSHDEVADSFVEDFYSVIPNDNRVVKYADYLVTNYIEESALFPPHLWASCTATIEKTTNCCEAFHSHFNSSFNRPHPNIFTFIYALKDVQLNTYIKINSLDIPRKFTNCESTKRMQYVANLIQLYKNKNISRFQFVKSVSYNYYKK